MNEEFYKKFLDYLVSEITGLWYRSYNPSKYSGFDENSTFYYWGYDAQTTMENDVEEQYWYESYQELAEDIMKYLKIVK